MLMTYQDQELLYTEEDGTRRVHLYYILAKIKKLHL